MIIHIMKDNRHNEWPWWDALDENDRCVGTEKILRIYRQHSSTGKLHKGTHPDPQKRSGAIKSYEGIRGISIYWYERK